MNPHPEHAQPDWDLLLSWIAVVETGSVSDAAQRLGISQAAVSQRVKQLEVFFGTPLLDRSTRPARPTAAGQRLFEQARDLLTQAQQMVESVRNVSRARRLTVRIGCVDSFAATVGPLLIKGLAGSSRQIRLWSGITPMLEDSLSQRQLDLAVTTQSAPTPGVVRTPLFSESYCLVLPARFELPPKPSLSDIGRHLQFIRYSARSLIGQQVDSYLDHCQEPLDRSYEFDTTDPLLSLVVNGMGFALSTPLCIWQSRHFLPDIRVLTLDSLQQAGRPYPRLSRRFYLAFRQGELGTLPKEVRELIRVAAQRQISRDIVSSLKLEAAALNLSDEGTAA